MQNEIKSNLPLIAEIFFTAFKDGRIGLDDLVPVLLILARVSDSPRGESVTPGVNPFTNL